MRLASRFPLLLPLLSIGLLGELSAGCGGNAPAVGASDETSPALTGGSVDLAGLLELMRPGADDTAILVNFWTTWCPPCLREMPELVELHRTRAGDGVRVLAVSLDLVMQPRQVDSPTGVRAFARERGFDLPIVIFDGDLQALAEELDLPGPIPFTLVRNAEGDVVDRQLGSASLERFEAMLAKAGG